MDKSQEEFQKDILEILGKFREDNEKFKKDFSGGATPSQTNQPIPFNINQFQNRPGNACITDVVIATKIPVPPEEMTKRAAAITKEVRPIMEKYKVSKLEISFLKLYD